MRKMFSLGGAENGSLAMFANAVCIKTGTKQERGFRIKAIAKMSSLSQAIEDGGSAVFVMEGGKIESCPILGSGLAVEEGVGDGADGEVCSFKRFLSACIDPLCRVGIAVPILPSNVRGSSPGKGGKRVIKKRKGRSFPNSDRRLQVTRTHTKNWNVALKLYLYIRSAPNSGMAKCAVCEKELDRDKAMFEKGKFFCGKKHREEFAKKAKEQPKKEVCEFC